MFAPSTLMPDSSHLRPARGRFSPSPLAGEGKDKTQKGGARSFRLPAILALAILFAGTVALSAQSPAVDPVKKVADPPKTDNKPLVVKLPDGTLLWLGSADGGERVTLTPREFQKLLDNVDSLKKELAARKPVAPSGCAVRGRVEKRGEQLVAVLKLTYAFRTAGPNAAVALGGRKAFLVAAALDGAKLPVLDTGDDGFAALVETAGAHTLVLDVEAPVTARGLKAEIGFDMGLPRAPITTFALDPPGGVPRVTLATKTPDPTKPTEVRRVAVDAKQLAPKGADAGMPLGPVESLEVTWDPPASVAQPADQVQSAEIDVAVVLTDGYVESTAKVKVRGQAREWKLVAPATADVSVDRVAAPGDTGPTQQPVLTKPNDPNKPVWKIELPAGSTGADWVVTAVVRQARPKSGAKSAAAPVGPFSVLDVFRQTGTVGVRAGPHFRFVFKHGPDLRRAEVPGASDDDASAALFRLTTGPTGATPVNSPLLTVEAWPVEGAVRVRPVYKLELTDAGWKVRAEIAVKPIRTEVDAITIDVPAEWNGLESEFDPAAVQGVSRGESVSGWAPVTVRLAAATKLPFSVVLLGTVPVPPGARKINIPFPRYPKSVERDSLITATVHDGLEVRGTGRGWEGEQPAAWGAALLAVPGADGKAPKVVAAITGRAERGFARAALSWQPHRPDVTVDVKTDVTVGERQVVVKQEFRLRSADGFPKSVRFHGPADALGFQAPLAFTSVAPGVWTFSPPDQKEATFRVSFALPLPVHADGPLALPVGLVWPMDAARVDVSVRVWASSVTGRTVSTAAAGWRELPPEAAPERDMLPALTLAASAEHPLVLEVRQATPESAVAVWVERALIEAGATEDGAVSYRARFRLARWLAPAVEVWLPGAIGPNPTARIDGVTAALQPVGEVDGGHRFRVNLPDVPPGRGAVLELRYTLPGSRQVLGETNYQPPRVMSAAYSGPVRWLITEASGAAPLLFSDRARPELRWRWRGPVFAPSAAPRADLELWFTSGGEPDANGAAPTQEGEPLAARQAAPDAVRVARVPWLALVIVCSLVVFLVAVLLTRLNAVAAGVVITALGGAFGIAAVLYPQPAAQVVAAGQPGLAVALFGVAAQALVRWHLRRRARYLPGFTRTLPEPTASAAPVGSVPSGRNRPGSTAAPAPTGSGS